MKKMKGVEGDWNDPFADGHGESELTYLGSLRKWAGNRWLEKGMVFW
jgi:hypothetical protein